MTRALILLLSLATVAYAQFPPAKVGKISNGIYENSELRLKLAIPKDAEVEQNSKVFEDQGVGTVFMVSHSTGDPAQRYVITVSADTLARNPKISSAQQYAKNARVALEKNDGFKTISPEKDVQIGQQLFSRFVLCKNTSSERYCKAAYVGLRGKYILVFNVEGRDEESLQGSEALFRAAIQLAP